MSFYLAIVSPLDTPLFELQFTSSRQPQSSTSSSFPSWSSFTHPNGEEKAGSVNLGLGAAGGPGSGSGNAERHVLQMIAHASLDAVEEVAEGTGSL